MGADLKIKIHSISGHCPVYSEGDEFVIKEGYILQASKDTRICMHSLSSIIPYYVALSHGISPVQLGLAKEGEAAYVQCLDPRCITGGGTVILKVEKF
ncbi:MAG: TIGR04076 family protein [Fidelibacterota bacterium]